MTGKQLKNSILQLAIQGKLVGQDPNDEPASALLARIRKEKEQLVKDGKLKKKDLVSEPIADEDKPFEIPESWEWVRVSQIMTVKGGKRVPLGYSWTTTPTKHVYIRVTDMKNGSITNKDLRYVTDDVYEKIKSYTISKNDLYVTVAGTIGAVGMVPEEFDGMNLTENADKLTDIAINKEYIVQCFNSPFIQGQFKALTNQMAQPKLSIRNILTLMFPLPPLPEQHRIVAKIEELMPLVEEYDKAQTQLDALNASLPEVLKKSILQEAIMGKLVPQDPNDEPASALLARIRKEKEQLVKEGKLKKKDLVCEPITDEEKPFEIPESWEWCRLYNVGITNTGTTPSKTNPSFFGDYISFLGPGDIHNSSITYGKNGLSKLGYEVARPVPANTIIQVCIGGSIGKCAIVDRESTFNQQINSLTTLACSHKYLFYCMQSDFFAKQMIENSTGTATPIINRGSWDLLLIPLPPLAEQHCIVAKIEELFATLK